jgi:cyclopropane fatty-acyl-phospholipid synthase-like methyltransferase
MGVDISAQQIAKGRTLIEALGLQNIILEQKNLLEIDESFRIFDYIAFAQWISRNY